jgi:magnesium transporter
MNIDAQVRELYVDRYPSEVARLVESSIEQADWLRELKPDALIRVLERIDPSLLRQVFMALTEAQQEQVLEASTVRLSLLILRGLEASEQEQVMARLPVAVSQELAKLLAFPDGTAGFYMDRPSAQFKLGDTVSSALDKLRVSHQQRARSIYVVDDDNALAGRVDVQDLAMSTGDTLLTALLNPVEGVVTLTSPRQDMLDIFSASRVDSIPVVDSDARLIGVVRYTSLFQAAEDQATANMQKMVGASAEERALSTPLFAVKKRLPWLHINLLTAFLAAAVVGLFESTIAQFTALAILLPVVAGQSGNAGSQALDVTMRGLALKEVNILQWRQVLSKEVKVGIIDGLALALTCGGGVYVWSGSPGLALVIGIAMVVSMVAAGISGALVPMMLIRAGQDPATASSIILTTVTDVAGFFSFLGTATILAFML